MFAGTSTGFYERRRTLTVPTVRAAPGALPRAPGAQRPPQRVRAPRMPAERDAPGHHRPDRPELTAAGQRPHADQPAVDRRVGARVQPQHRAIDAADHARRPPPAAAREVREQRAQLAARARSGRTAGALLELGRVEAPR